MNYYICRKMRLLNWLCEHGHYPLRSQADIKGNPKFKVWVYESTPELLNCVEDYYHSDEFLNRNN